MKLWIARDKDNDLYLYDDVPQKCKTHFIQQDYKSVMELSDKLFPEVTFENSPQEVEIKLVNNTANDFAEDLLTNCKPLEGEFSKFVDDNFDNLI